MPTGGGGREAGGVVLAEVKRRQRPHGPGGRLFPAIHACGIGENPGRMRVRAALEVVIEKGLQVFDAEFIRSVAGESQLPQFVAVMIDAGMAPRPADKRTPVLILVLERLVSGARAVGVFLIP